MQRLSKKAVIRNVIRRIQIMNQTSKMVSGGDENDVSAISVDSNGDTNGSPRCVFIHRFIEEKRNASIIVEVSDQYLLQTNDSSGFSGPFESVESVIDHHPDLLEITKDSRSIMYLGTTSENLAKRVSIALGDANRKIRVMLNGEVFCFNNLGFKRTRRKMENRNAANYVIDSGGYTMICGRCGNRVQIFNDEDEQVGEGTVVLHHFSEFKEGNVIQWDDKFFIYCHTDCAATWTYFGLFLSLRKVIDFDLRRIGRLNTDTMFSWGPLQVSRDSHEIECKLMSAEDLVSKLVWVDEDDDTDSRNKEIRINGDCYNVRKGVFVKTVG